MTSLQGCCTQSTSPRHGPSESNHNSHSGLTWTPIIGVQVSLGKRLQRMARAVAITTMTSSAALRRALSMRSGRLAGTNRYDTTAALEPEPFTPKWGAHGCRG
jgi:hypothetical protein